MGTTVIVIAIFYLTGCILAIGVITAFEADKERKTGFAYGKLKYTTSLDIIKDPEWRAHLIASWLTVCAGFTVYISHCHIRHRFICYKF